MDPFTAVYNTLSNYANFYGRARRTDIAWFGLAQLLLISVAIPARAGLGGGIAGTVLLSLLFVPLMLPAVALAVRRWHDLNQSGWLQLLTLIPVVGGLIVFVCLWFVPGTKGANTFGRDPREPPPGPATPTEGPELEVPQTAGWNDWRAAIIAAERGRRGQAKRAFRRAIDASPEHFLKAEPRSAVAKIVWTLAADGYRRDRSHQS